MDIFNVNAKGYNFTNNDKLCYSTCVVGMENAVYRANQLEDSENITYVEIVSITTGEVIYTSKDNK